MIKNIFNTIHEVLIVMLLCTIMITCTKLIISPDSNTDDVEISDNTLDKESSIAVKGCTAGVSKALYNNITSEVSVTKLETTNSKLSYKIDDNTNDTNFDSTVMDNNLEMSNSNYLEINSESPEIIENEEIIADDITYSEYELYELAKIIMCEAEGGSQECKEYVGQIIINRVNHTAFPNTIHDVIFDRRNGVQFTPTISGGRWYKVEPNQDCYNAAYKVANSPTPLTSALYFESCKGNSWHSRNLTFITKIDNTKFYK